MCSVAGDKFCLDIVLPDKPRLAIYFDHFQEMADLLNAALQAKRIDRETCGIAADLGAKAIIVRSGP
jgi:hypothetical protein